MFPESSPDHYSSAVSPAVTRLRLFFFVLSDCLRRNPRYSAMQLSTEPPSTLRVTRTSSCSLALNHREKGSRPRPGKNQNSS